MSQERLDELVAALASARPVLDDLTRARVAAVIQVAGPTAAQVRRPGHRRRWRLGAAGAAAAAVLAVGLFVRGSTARHAVVEMTPRVVVRELPEGAMLSAEPGTSVRGQVAGAAVTVYGPGWAIRHGGQIIVDTDALVVDRSSGDTPLEVKVRTATIRVQHATFSVDGTYVLRVTVIRGEILLSCDGNDASEPVTAGGTAACGPARTGDGRFGPVARPSADRRLTDPSPPAPGTEVSDAGAPVPQMTTPATSDAPTRAPRGITASVSQTREPLTEADPLSSPQAPGGPAISTPHTITATAAPSPPWRAAAAGPPSAAVSPPSPDAIPVAVPRPIIAVPVVPVTPASASATAPSKTAARYAAAEQLLLSDPAAARTELSGFVKDVPTAPEAAPALLDLARLAAAAGDAVAARAALDRLAAHPRAAWYAMPADYLRCTLEETDPGWRACLTNFRAAFPGSSRDADVLGRLAIATAEAGDCQAALPLLLEFRRRYPNGPSDAEVRSWTARCAHATTLP